nr:MAG TPA: receptor binding complex [Caudoviricetes sp.]
MDETETELVDLTVSHITGLQGALDNKVSKVTGKGLSTNDYTTAEKTKLSGIAEGAQKNTVTGVKGGSETSYRIGNVNITATNIGLGNVNNTSDKDKPISTATQTALNGKQATVTGAATTITGSNLTASRALVSNANGKVAVSDVTSTELGYLDGVTSAIQTQLNGKVPTSRTVNGKALNANITLGASDVGALSTAGGTLTGNLTGEYITGTWLRTTKVSDKIGDIATIDSDGWIYKRTLQEAAEDLTSGNPIRPATIELFPGTSAGHGGYIDFHYNNDPSDYTSRLIDHNGYILYNNKPLLNSSHFIRLYNQEITFTNGVATFTHDNINANTVCLVQYRASSVTSSYPNSALATTTGNGHNLTIVAKSAGTVTTHVNILIFTF